ncbi:MAG: DUF2125 domain-containing protein [Paracoccaceae bacterium]
MSRFRPALAALALSLAVPLSLAAPLPALAEVSADQVWTLMQDQVAGAGGTLRATATRQGNRLVLSHPEMLLANGTILQLPDLTLSETPDRAVNLELPPQFPLVVDTPPGTDSPDTLTFTVSAPDLAVQIRGLGDQADFSISAGSLSAALDRFDMPPGAPRPDDVFLALALADLSLIWAHDAVSADKWVDASGSLGTLHAEMRIDAAAENLDASLALDLSALSAALSIFAPADTEQQFGAGAGEPDIPAALALLDQGLRLSFQATSGPAALVFDAPKSPDGPASLHVTAGSGAADVRFDRTGIVYDTSTTGLTLAFLGQVPDMPIDRFGFSLGEYRTNYRLGFPGTPDLAGADPAWGVLFRLTGMDLSPELWALLDPGQVLPQDPMSLVLDFAGTYRLDPRALEPGFTIEPGAPPPLTAATLTLTQAMVEGLGLSFTGAGGLDLDFTDLVTYDGAPRPSGKLSFVTTGANALLDRLERLGLLASDEMTGARLGLLFIGRMAGDDRLETDLEFRDTGFYLNGQKIR